VKRDPVVLIIIAMVVTAMLVFGYHMSRSDKDPAGASVGAMKGKTAPDFELKSLEGKTVKLSDYHGKAVLLNFWATYCGPCKVEMPWLVELQKQYGPEGLQIVGVAMDDASQDDIAKFAKDMGVNYPILVGKESVGDSYGGIQFLPATFYIGRDGKFIDRVFGLKGRSEIENEVKTALSRN
jgi:thiol-disulfide isomerase/thioredoxin